LEIAENTAQKLSEGTAV